MDFYCFQQDGEFLVRTLHVEYVDGGILDPDDMLTDLVEDKDKVRNRVYTNTRAGARGYFCEYYLACFSLKCTVCLNAVTFDKAL